MRSRFIVLIIFTFLVVGLKFHNDRTERKDFAVKLEEAKILLSKSPVGLRALHQLGSYGIYANPVKINAWSGDDISQINGSSGGAIALGKNDQLEIFVNKSLSSVQIAHIIAHEVKHIEDEKERVRVLQDFDELKGSLDQVAFDMYQGKSLSLLLPRFEKEVNYVLQSLFCTEYRAHLVNRGLHNSGLNLDHPANSDELVPYIERRYINRFGLRLNSNVRNKFVQTCAKYKSYSRYQEVLLEDIFDIIPKKVSLNKDFENRSMGLVGLTAFEFEEVEETKGEFENSKSNLPQFSKEQDPNMPEVEKVDESLASKSHITSTDNLHLKKNEADIEQIDLASEIQND